MTDPDRNAAIWYARDGYDPEGKGINGRRVAGASFLKGFFRHGNVTEFVSVTRGDIGAAEFAAEKDRHNPQMPHRVVHEQAMDKLGPVGTLHFASPNCAEQCWRRQAFGMHSYSICGITHTTATQAVMRGFFDLRAGPQAEWDGLICTSRPVHAASVRNIEIAENFLRARFGFVPPRPQMPVIPLGLNCDDFAHDPAAAARLRQRMGWGEDDVAVVTLSRLTPYGKFDPGPLFVALQRAQETLAGRRRLSFLACGLYADDHSRRVFEDCARLLMPDVAFHHLPGDDAAARRETLSGGDIFAFPVDNIQETFGLAPLEAMAAGLPVVVSDWDGMRDTVTAETGFRIPARSVRAAASEPEARGYLAGALTYEQYGNRLSMLTDVNVAEMAGAFAVLALNRDLRKEMGQQGRLRALTSFDWRVIIPRVQDFWAELAQIRRTSAADPSAGSRANPVAPLPMDLFASYPSHRLDRETARLVFTGTRERMQQIYKSRRYQNMGNPAEKLATLQKVSEALIEHESDGATVAGLAREMGWNADTVERCALFFLKYDLARTL